MENFVSKDLTFPENEWWEERKTDLSFLYTTDHDGNHLTPTGSIDGRHKAELSLDDFENREFHLDSPVEEAQNEKRAKAAESSVTLNKWVTEMQREESDHKPSITSLAGYINIAYPILKLLNPKPMTADINQKEMQQKFKKISSNIQTVLSTIDTVQTVVSNSNLPPEQAQALKNAIQERSKTILEKCELANVLANMVKNIAHINQPSAAKVNNKTFGSSVDLK